MSATDHNASASVPQPPCIPPRPTSSLVYFAFGSNLSSTQMGQRCPLAKGISLGRLRSHSFIINTRGYANVVPSAAAAAASSTEPEDVYGVLWQLHSQDEKALLDQYEGVGLGCYEDVLLPVEMLDKEEYVVGVVWALVYVDALRTTAGAPQEEYVGRMNRGIEEARREWGLPGRYMRAQIRKFIPETG